jgi:hypothetical protein
MTVVLHLHADSRKAWRVVGLGVCGWSCLPQLLYNSTTQGLATTNMAVWQYVQASHLNVYRLTYLQVVQRHYAQNTRGHWRRCYGVRRPRLVPL